MRKENTGETIVTIIIIIKYVYEKYIQNVLLLTMALFMSCGDDDEVKLPDTKDVNYANIAGTWRLSEWNGEKIDGDTRYYYIKFDRKAEKTENVLIPFIQTSTVLRPSKFPAPLL